MLNITSASFTTTWKAEPNFRGTFNIISTCLSTLTICLWSAIHVDIPSRRSSIRNVLSKIGWLVNGLLAPAALLNTAVCQWWMARDLAATARSRGLKWTMTHGFYAAMGGFVLDTTPYFIVDEETRFTLSPSGVKFLIAYAPELVPGLTKSNIQDRSKADGLAKALLVSQLIFFCTSCLARRHQSLPLSLLEITTLAHSLCTVLTYIIWWNKPLNILEPTTIIGPQACDLAALLRMLAPSIKYILGGQVPAGQDDEAEWDCFIHPSQHHEVIQAGPSDSHNLNDSRPVYPIPNTDFLYNPPCNEKAIPQIHPQDASQTHLLVVTQRIIQPGSSDHNRLVFASRAAHFYASRGADLSKSWPSTLVDPHRGLGNVVIDIATTSKLWRVVPLNLSLLIYVLPHFYGWNAHFRK